MDKEFIKGILMLVGAVVAIVVVFIIIALHSDDKAICIADALKAHVSVAKIDKLCRLSGNH